MKATEFNKIQKIISGKDNQIVIVCHVNPDGDAIGSSLGLYHFLKNDQQKNVTVISPNSFPSFLGWMPASQQIIIAKEQPEKSSKIIKSADLLFCLDFNDTNRTAGLSKDIFSSKALKVLIDHHPDPTNDFDVFLSDTSASSTAELIYEFIILLNKQELIDLPIAQCLYAGIITDTGSFSYACNNPRTYYITAYLLSLGLDGEEIQRLIYDTYSEDRMRLLGYCLSERLKVLVIFETAYIYLTKDDLERFNYQEGDTEGVVNYALSMDGIKLAAIFIERNNEIKISFRSKGTVNVNVLARKYFDGGGHKNASGGYRKKSMEETIAYFEGLLEDISAEDFRLLSDVTDND